MTVIRCTNKLLKLVAAGSASTSKMEPADDDWYADLLWIERRKCLLAAHAGTLFAFFEPDITKAHITQFGLFLLGLIVRELGAEDLPADTFGHLASSDFVIGRTCSRSVLGTMTDMRYQVEAAVYDSGGLHRLDLLGLNRSLRRIPFSAIKYDRAIERTRALAGQQAETPHRSERAVASPSDRIDDVFRRYLAARRASLSSDDYRRHEAIVEFFKLSLNGYAYEGLSTLERKRWDLAFAGGDEDAYTKLFGADKIPGEVGAFVGYFMVRKVATTKSIIAATGRVIADLLEWLVTQGLVRPPEIVDAKERALTTGADLPRAEELASLLYDLAERSTLDVHSLAHEDYIEDHLTITRVEPGVLWFSDIGPVHVGAAASRIARPGWSVNIVLGRQDDRWQVLEVGNVYPD